MSYLNYWPKILVFGSLLLAVAQVSGCRRSSPAKSITKPAEKFITQPPSQARLETDQEESCREFVQGFYDWYINGHLKGSQGTPWFDVPKKRPEILSDKLRQLLDWESAEEDRTHEIGALDFDPFLAAQDWSEAYEVKSVTVRNHHCDALVTGSPDLRKLELESKSDHWVFTNFDYSYFSEDGKTRQYPDDDLIHILATDREQESAEAMKNSRK